MFFFLPQNSRKSHTVTGNCVRTWYLAVESQENNHDEEKSSPERWKWHHAHSTGVGNEGKARAYKDQSNNIDRLNHELINSYVIVIIPYNSFRSLNSVWLKTHQILPLLRWERSARKTWTPRWRRWQSPQRNWCRCSGSTATGSPCKSRDTITFRGPVFCKTHFTNVFRQ